MYTKEFIDNCKQEFPQYIQLHKALDTNSFEVGELISQTIQENISIDKILSTNSLEELKKIALISKKRNDLFNEWHRLYENELNKRKYLMSANYLILLIQKNNSLKLLFLNSIDLNTKKNIMKRYLKNAFSYNIQENLSMQLITILLNKINSTESTNDLFNQLLQLIDDFKIEPIIRTNSILDSIIILNNIKKDVLALQKYCNNIDLIEAASIKLFKSLITLTNTNTSEINNFSTIKILFNDTISKLSSFDDFIPIYELITSPLIDLQSLKFKNDYKDSLSKLLDLSNEDLSDNKNINEIISIFKNNILDIK